MILIEKPLCVKKYLSEKGQEIIKEIAKNRIIGILGSMNLGKSYFMLNDLNYYCMDKDYKLIIVIPTTSQLDQVYKRYKEQGVTAQYARFKANKEARVVLTTPDSLPKIIASCEAQSKRFILAIDEAHEIELSYMYRKAFKNILNASKNKICECTLYFSATFDNLILSDTITFDKFFSVKVENTFINAKKFELMTMEKQDVPKMASLIKKLGKTYEQVFYKVDSLNKLNELNKILGTEEVKGVQETFVKDKPSLVAIIQEEEKNIFLSSKNRKGNEINEQITSDKDISKEFKYIGFTSLVNSGIEIKTSGSIVVINFANKTFNFCNEIQFIGRFRNGVELYIITISEPVEVRRLKLKQQRANKRDKNKDLTKSAIKERSIKRYLPRLIPYETIMENVKERAESIVNSENKFYSKNKNTLYSIEDIRLETKSLNRPYITFNEDTELLEIDYLALNAYCYNKYINQYLNFPKMLLQKFKEHTNLNIGEEGSKIEDVYKLSSFYEEDQEAKEIVKELEEEKEKQDKEETEDIENSMKFIANNVDDNTLKLLLDKQLAIEYTENNELKEHLETWQQLKDKREEKEKYIYELSRYIKNISEIQAFKIVANCDMTKIRHILQSANMVYLNKIYNSDPRASLFNETKRHKKFKATRDLVEADKKKLNGKSITDEMKEQLFNLYIEKGIEKNKKFTKAKKEALVNYLEKIYKFKKMNNEESKKTIISSLRKDINDLISIRSTE